MADIAKQEEIVEKNSGSNKLLIIISSVLFLILIAGGVMAYLMLTSDDEVIEDANNAKQSYMIQKNAYSHKSEGRNKDYTHIGPMVPLDKFIVNLSSDSGSRYLRAALNLELSSEELQAEVEKKTPLIRDIIIKVLSAKSYEEISTIRGKESLKDELVSEINKVFIDGRVENVFFTEFVVQ